MEATRSKGNGRLTSGQKAAAVIVSLGASSAAQIYKYLNEEEVEKLTVEVARLGQVRAEQSRAALEDFYQSALTQKVVTEGGYEYARAVLEKTYGEAGANAMLKKVGKMMKNRSFDFISRTDTKNLFSFLQHERSQTIALVLSYVDSGQAAEIIALLPEEKRSRVVEGIARMESASPEIIRIVESELQKKFNSILSTDFTTAIGGVDFIADVMNNMERSAEKTIFDEITQKDPDLADTIRKKMFVFEDIMGLDERAIQRFIRECDMKDIVYALKNASQEMLALFYSNMSERMAETVRSDLEITVNVRLRDVEEAQQRIVGAIRRLEEQGEIIISKSGKDEIIV